MLVASRFGFVRFGQCGLDLVGMLGVRFVFGCVGWYGVWLDVLGFVAILALVLEGFGRFRD